MPSWGQVETPAHESLNPDKAVWVWTGSQGYMPTRNGSAAKDDLAQDQISCFWQQHYEKASV